MMRKPQLFIICVVSFAFQEDKFKAKLSHHEIWDMKYLRV